MTANELRVGNYVEIDQYPNNRVVVEIKDGSSIDQAIKFNAKPIPLTEEWMLSFGFESSLDDPECTGTETPNGEYGIIRTEQMSLEIMFGFTNDGSILVDLNDSPFKLDYIHQLQNLYFALTGEELKIK